MFERRRSGRPRISVVAAARPNFMKVGPVIRALEADADVELVHTGQHYDDRMSASFFRELDLPEPDVNLGIGSGTHGKQTAGVLVAYEQHLIENDADAVVVVGDVNSTVASAMTAVKLQIPVAHVEAGLRSRDWNMPEEVNRVLTDRISRWLLTPSSDADENLKNEGVPTDWIHLVGNVMIDTLLTNLPRARDAGESVRERLELDGDYGVMTLHRPSNVDQASSLQALLGAIDDVVGDVTIVFPAHPRTLKRLREFGVEVPPSMRAIDPLGYLDFVGLMSDAKVVLTDSGGIQEETSILGVPCVTLRENTERPVTCEFGTNRLAGTAPDGVAAAVEASLSNPVEPAEIPFWDGRAGERIAEVLLRDLLD